MEDVIQSSRVDVSSEASTMMTSAGCKDCAPRLASVFRSAAVRCRVGITTVTGTSSANILTIDRVQQAFVKKVYGDTVREKSITYLSSKSPQSLAMAHLFKAMNRRSQIYQSLGRDNFRYRSVLLCPPRRRAIIGPTDEKWQPSCRVVSEFTRE